MSKSKRQVFSTSLKAVTIQRLHTLRQMQHVMVPRFIGGIIDQAILEFFEKIRKVTPKKEE